MTYTTNSESRSRVIVLLKDIDLIGMLELRFAETISRDITAFCVVNNDDTKSELIARWHELCIGIPLVIRYMPDRRVVEPLLEFIRSVEFSNKPDDEITVVLSRYTISKWWQRLLHNSTSISIERQLLEHERINVVVLPFQLTDGKPILMET